MSTMISEVDDALKEAGASEEKARKAAEALTNYDTRLNKIESELATFRAETKGEFNLLRWMIGFNLAMTVAILWKIFSA
jgi:hypothetical protein